ncbi:hypothetical protein GCM10010191_47110 [Actinomadura vinacea]|uniref:Uncharacterized protein n=1 Tax=Actinomadura vinacea TaxID=115336 RepID=A0ABN3JFR0_9ACTN
MAADGELVQLRRNEPSADLAPAFGGGAATAHRYVTEVVDWHT